MSSSHPHRLALAIMLAGLGSSALAETLTRNLSVNGFATAGFTTVTEDFGGHYLGSATLDSGIDERGSYQFDNVLGVQLGYQVDEKINLVGQLISSGRNDYDTRAEWAYLGYRVDENLRLRMGRRALPIFMYSENLRVGQAYPWARLPVEVYSTDVSSTDGVDALYRLPLGDWSLDAQVLLGRTKSDSLTYVTYSKRQRGASLQLGNGNFAVRTSYNDASMTITGFPATFPVVNGEKASFSSLGLSYDDGVWFAAAEITQTRVTGFLPDRDAAFASVGHYFGKWLPYVTYSQSKPVKGEECRSALVPSVGAATAEGICRGMEREQTSYSAGFRYDFNKLTSAKLQVDHVTGFNRTAGAFGALPAGKLLQDDDKTNVITFNINAAF